MREYQTDVAAFVLRIALGMMFLAHGFTKLLVLTPEGTAEYFHTLGFPGFFSYIVIIFEIGGGALLLLGILTRAIALIAFFQLAIITIVHWSNGWSFTNPGGGWEYPAFMSLTAFSLALLGTGRFSVLAGKKYPQITQQ